MSAIAESILFSAARRRWPRRRALLRLALLLAAAALVWATAYFSERYRVQAQVELGRHRLELLATNLRHAIEQYRYLPRLLAQDERVRRLLKSPKDAELAGSMNQYLEFVNAQAATMAIYVMDADGLAHVASNWGRPDSFVGSNYGFRPYFSQAMRTGRGHFYAIGTVSREAGYYLSQAVYDQGRAIGVVVVKADLHSLEGTWAPLAERVIVMDANGISFLSSNPHWKFRTMTPLGDPQRHELTRTRQYHNVELRSLGVEPAWSLSAHNHLVSLPERAFGSRRDYLMQGQSLPELGWTVHILADAAPVRLFSALSALIAAILLLLVCLAALVTAQRRRRITEKLAARQALQRAHDELEQKVVLRTADLVVLNGQLQREIQEREHAELVLREAQDELVQAGKLAVLGQMAAGVTHELNQPLAAIRTFSDNAALLIDRDRAPEARENLQQISAMTQRMARITGQLKGFARRSDGGRDAVADVGRAIDNALMLLETRLRQSGVRLDYTAPPPLRVRCDAVRLEQVLVNLLRNALDAMETASEKRLGVRIETDADSARIVVEDSGGGVPEALLRQVFDPFFTTKEPGKGLGLGLAISSSIVSECGGSLKMANTDTGARCVVELGRAAG